MLLKKLDTAFSVTENIAIGLKYQIITSWPQIEKYRPDWFTLIQKIPFYPPTLTYEWNDAWINANQDKIESLYIILVWDYNNELIAIIPMFSYRAKIFSVPLRVLSLIGARDHMMTDIIALPEHQLPVINLLIKILNSKFRKWDIYTFRRLNYSKGDTIFLGRILTKNKIPFNNESFVKIPFLYLDGNWDGYYQGRKKHFKKEVRRKLKILQKEGEIRYDFNKTEKEPVDLQHFYELEDKGWKGASGSSILKRPHLYKLYQNLSRIHCPNIVLRNFNMYLNDRLISSSICFETRNGLYVFKIAYDESYHKSSPGLLLRLYELEYSFNKGLKIYDFSGKHQKWMDYFTDRWHYSLDFVIYRKHFSSWIRYMGFTKLRPFANRYPFFKNLILPHITE